MAGTTFTAAPTARPRSGATTGASPISGSCASEHSTSLAPSGPTCTSTHGSKRSGSSCRSGRRPSPITTTRQSSGPRRASNASTPRLERLRADRLLANLIKIRARCSHGAMRRSEHAASKIQTPPQGRGYNIYETVTNTQINRISALETRELHCKRPELLPRRTTLSSTTSDACACCVAGDPR